MLWQLRVPLGPVQGRGWGEGGLPGWTEATATIPRGSTCFLSVPLESSLLLVNLGQCHWSLLT